MTTDCGLGGIDLTLASVTGIVYSAFQTYALMSCDRLNIGYPDSAIE